jgi:transposase
MLEQSYYTIGCDAHKHYSMFAVLDEHGKMITEIRVNHQPGAIHDFLSRFPKGTPVALESVGNWYWIVDEIEASGCVPLMAHAAKAKVMMGNIHKTDKLDAKGLATLQHLGSLPAVWIAPGETRDHRELPRTRMVFSKMRTALKNRIHSTLAKYGLSLKDASDIYAPKWRAELTHLIHSLPEETRRCMEQELELLDLVQDHIDRLELRIHKRFQLTTSMQLLKSMPGIGEILAIVIDLEIGDIDRFPSHRHFASYAGTVPKVKSSGGKFRYGRMVKQSNHYLRWAFIEAATTISRCSKYPTWRGKYAVRLYQRIRRRKGHAIAVGAVARHLAESTYWVLKKRESYHPPELRQGSKNKALVSPRQGEARE